MATQEDIRQSITKSIVESLKSGGTSTVAASLGH